MGFSTPPSTSSLQNFDIPPIEAAIHIRSLKFVRFWRILAQHGCVVRGYVGIYHFEGWYMGFRTPPSRSCLQNFDIPCIDAAIHTRRLKSVLDLGRHGCFLMGSWEYATSKVRIYTYQHARQLPGFRIVIFLVLTPLFTSKD
jgi:hypothetical protein